MIDEKKLINYLIVLLNDITFFKQIDMITRIKKILILQLIKIVKYKKKNKENKFRNNELFLIKYKLYIFTLI